MAAEKQTTVRIDEELLMAVKMACVQRGTNQTAAIDEGLRLWLGQDEAQPSPFDGLSSSHRRMIETIIHSAREGIEPEMLNVIEVAAAAIRRRLADESKKARKAG